MGDCHSSQGDEQGPELSGSQGADSEVIDPPHNSSIAGKLALKLIGGYQKFSQYTPPVCRFEPSCSEYTRQAIVKYGFVKGTAMGTWRICRCHPFSEGGYDPVP